MFAARNALPAAPIPHCHQPRAMSTAPDARLARRARGAARQRGSGAAHRHRALQEVEARMARSSCGSARAR